MQIEQNEYLTLSELYQIAHQAVSQYQDTQHADVKLLCQSENATFVVTTGQTRYALRIHRPNYHCKQTIQSELDWLDALKQHGISVPQAKTSLHGDVILTCSTQNSDVRYAVLFDWIAGDMPTTEVDLTAFQQLGKITAQLHQHSKAWQRSAAFKRIIWDHHSMVSPKSHWGDWRDAPHLKTTDHRIIEDTVQKIAYQLQSIGKTPEYYGLIHADLRLTNLLLKDQQIGVIDFDDCGMGWFMHDLAAAISFNEHHANAKQWIDHWLEGYETQAHISQVEYDLIPTFVMQRRIQMLAWTGSHADTDMTRSLGLHWADETTRLCKKYLDHDQLPVGA
ncbi:phosphotransferase [Acinetobacter apis]|uniref:Ser/Thr protein kinase RdoA involved in Cpx stress response, MazF antagonist n=1 Tax=Acinetobacter apis TaxID=1229165 RepID=A0A217EF73_9GAMM|nr:phosphotransferase [Acinetobacter apis]SNQ29139.1 Ser/Thr protein kinase RdoA involved in Cpx stress response, MazF antagonist [Acinetobacter apis]